MAKLIFYLKTETPIKLKFNDSAALHKFVDFYNTCEIVNMQITFKKLRLISPNVRLVSYDIRIFSDVFNRHR